MTILKKILIVLIVILYSFKVQSQPLYGVRVQNAGVTMGDKARLIRDSLGANAIRTVIISSQWDGTSPVYDTNKANGLYNIVNITAYPTGIEQPFITSSRRQGFKDTLTLILNHYPDIKIIMIDNEEQTNSYHYGPLSDYGTNMLQAAYEVAHIRGVKVADGGILNGAGLHIKVYNWLKDSYNNDTAISYAISSGMTPHQKNFADSIYNGLGISDTNLDFLSKQIDTIFLYKNYVDYWNLHYYENPNSDTPADTVISYNVLRYQKEYLSKVGGKPMITNETGQRNNTQPGLVRNMLNEWFRLGTDYVCWWSGNGDSGATPLTDDDGNVQDNGKAFKDWLKYTYRNQEDTSLNFYTPVNHGVYPPNISSFTTLSSVFLTNQTRGDTVKITGNTNGWYIGGVNGIDKFHPFVIYVVGKDSINGGIGIENCKYVKIIAPDSIVLKSGGTNGYIKGHADYIQVSGIISLNGLNGGWWLKQEASTACDYPNPDYYLYPNHQRYIWFTDFRFGNPDGTQAVGGEAIYAGSTGSYERDAVPCRGGSTYKPMWMNGIHILNGTIYNAGRTGIQLSGADSGFNEIKNIRIYNSGRELNTSQGAGIRTGYGTNNNTEISNNLVKNSFIYNYDIETGANFHNNIGDSAGYWYQTLNTQPVPSAIFSSALLNSKVSIKDNIMGVNTASPVTGYAVYGSYNYSDSNVVCNNTPSIDVLSEPFVYSSDCPDEYNTPIDTFGTWGYQDGTFPTLDSFTTYKIKGIHYLFQWSDLKSSYAGAYNWNIVTAKIDSAINRNIFCSLQFNVGQGSPEWVLDSVGSYNTVGVPTQPGPYPRYYNPKYKIYYNQFLHDIGAYLSSLSMARKRQILFWQIAEGSTGDGQPYKGVLDSCQAPGNTCTHADSVATPQLGDPYVPQDRFEFAWEQFRRNAWDTVALSTEYQSVDTIIALMFNTGNSANDLEFATADSIQDDTYDDNGYVEGHFSYLPITPYVKSGTLSHVYSFRAEKSHFNRVKPPDRGEMQGPIKLTPYKHKEVFALLLSALTGDLKMFNIDQGYMGLKYPSEQRADHRMTDFFTLYTNTKTQGFNVPCFKVDYGDTVLFPTSTYGALIDPDSLQQQKFLRRLYSYQYQSNEFESGSDFDEWKYWQAVDKFVNPARKIAIDALYPGVYTGNNRDSMWYADHVLNAAYNYEKNLHMLNTSNVVVPVYRVGPDTALYGRFAGKPKLVSDTCMWMYDISNELILNNSKDSLEIDITYLDNNSGGQISVWCQRCNKWVILGSPTTINTNTGLWKTKTIIIPKFYFKPNGVDFSIKFNGGANTTIGMVEVKNLTKQTAGYE